MSLQIISRTPVDTVTQVDSQIIPDWIIKPQVCEQQQQHDKPTVFLQLDLPRNLVFKIVHLALPLCLGKLLCIYSVLKRELEVFPRHC